MIRSGGSLFTNVSANFPDEEITMFAELPRMQIEWLFLGSSQPS